MPVVYVSVVVDLFYNKLLTYIQRLFEQILQHHLNKIGSTIIVTPLHSLYK